MKKCVSLVTIAAFLFSNTAFAFQDTYNLRAMSFADRAGQYVFDAALAQRFPGVVFLGPVTIKG
ncbi:MAG: hypothetical protein NTV07_05700, partial [Candidatus Omnitrophica bacterium]|nr:hypothetical protein [Candidatus Omnitrophota bacterium]